LVDGRAPLLVLRSKFRRFATKDMNHRSGRVGKKLMENLVTGAPSGSNE
jgi:hypothetical protein